MVRMSGGAEQRSREPVFTNPAWPELQSHPQPGLLTAGTPARWDCRRRTGCCPGGAGGTPSWTGLATGQWSQLRGLPVAWSGHESSACGFQSIRGRWCDEGCEWGRRSALFSYHIKFKSFCALYPSGFGFRTTANRTTLKCLTLRYAFSTLLRGCCS